MTKTTVTKNLKSAGRVLGSAAVVVLNAPSRNRMREIEVEMTKLQEEHDKLKRELIR